MTVPLLDLTAQHAAIREELDAAIAEVVAEGRYIGGPRLERFERDFAAYCGAERCVGCSSGTDALTVALRAAGIGLGDEVIVPAMTFIATAESVIEAGARPVIVDTDPDTGNVTPEIVEAAVGPRTAAIVVVHLFGQPVDLDAFRRLADGRGLLLIEDAAQAHGADWAGRRAGSVGDASALKILPRKKQGPSFFPGKNLGALGDAGAITTSRGEIADRAARLRDHGRTDKYTHEELGLNARLDALQAAVLSVKLPHLDRWNEARRAHAAFYAEAFAEVEGVDPLRLLPGANPVWHQYVVRVVDREEARAALSEAGIATGVHYPMPLNRQPALAGLADPDGAPGADRLAERVLSLPVFPELAERDRDRIVEVLRAHAVAREAPVGR